ncbi:MAG TPA: hypothetical protein DCM86_02880 [Verrucomicrobiales bacterium]|nr:hypothetical protein [Verrucomicrobiales bacterium]
MKLKLKENPREWQKFAAVVAILLCGVAWMARRRGWLPPAGFLPVCGLALLVPLTSLVIPRPFRVLYRVGMTASHHVGQVMGRILLTLFFLLVLTPLGLLLRLAGKDLLRLRPAPEAKTFWTPCRDARDLDRMF